MTVLGSFDSQKPVHIYGAGVAGLVLGYFLKKENFQVTIFEKQNRVGGKIQTEQTKYGIVEKAANGIFSNDDVWDLLNELQLDALKIPKGIKKFIYRDEVAQTLPLSKKEILKILWRLFKKVPEKARNVEATIFDVFEPLLGEQVCRDVLTPALSGVYAAEATELSFSLIFPFAHKEGNYLKMLSSIVNQRKSSRIKHGQGTTLSFNKGMQEFIDALESNLKENIVLGQSDEISPDVNSIICTEAYSASSLLGKYPQVALLLEDIQYGRLLTTTLFLNKEIPMLKESFGILFPKSSSYHSMGIVNNSYLFPHRSKENTFSYTFISQEHSFDKDLEKIFGKDFADYCIESQTKVWEKAIPLYNSSLLHTLKSLPNYLPKNILLFGNYTGSISIREMISAAKAFAQGQRSN